MSDPSGRLVEVAGDHYNMGLQHGRHARSLRPAILEAIALRQAELERDGADDAFVALVSETERLLQTYDPATVAMIAGLADGLAIPFDGLLYYNLVAFLADALTTRRAPSEGCTTWAAAGAATAGGEPLLVKNRDYRREHLPLQLVVRARPAAGYRTLYVTSAGSPGVFVAGMNEAGLAVADTHVPSTDVGPGLPSYALAMHLLEEQHDVAGALAYLQATPRLGRNNLILADCHGELAIFEIGHRGYGIRRPVDGLLVNTNHFNHPAMAAAFVDTEPPALRGNSFRRYEKASRALRAAYGRIDVSFAQWLMASHDGPLASLCRHPSQICSSSTIAAIIFRPQQGVMQLGHGQPCEAEYLSFVVS